MSDSQDRANQIARSWDANASAWNRVVRERALESRRVATDAAIVEAVLVRRPRRVLDVGCGEGWLARELGLRGVRVVGIDGSEALIAAARTAGCGEFHIMSFAEVDLYAGELGESGFDVVVCNFSLLHEDISGLIKSLGRLICSNGVLLIQTLHPWAVRGDARYVDGWRTEHFQGLGDGFTEPMPWYFRTLGSWSEQLSAAGFGIDRITEPAHPETGEPLSLLIVASPSHATFSGAGNGYVPCRGP